MNYLQRLSLSLAAVAMIAFAGCKNDKDNIIKIDFEKPTDGQVVSRATPLEIHIHFTATDELHDIEIVLHPKNDASNKIIDFDTHVHKSEYVFEQTVDLSSFPAGTMFHLEAEVCKDHDCKEKVDGHIDFSIN